MSNIKTNIVKLKMEHSRRVCLKKATQLLAETETEDFVPSDEDCNYPPFNINSEKNPSYSSDEVSVHENTPIAQLFQKSGAQVPVKILGKSHFVPENFKSILTDSDSDDSDGEDITDDEENEEIELEYMDLNHMNDASTSMILGTMYNQEIVEKNSANEMDENYEDDEDPELNQGDDVIMEENMAEEHEAKRPKLGEPLQSRKGTGTLRGKGIPKNKGTSLENTTPEGIKTPRDKKTPSTPGSYVTSLSKRTPQAMKNPRSTGSLRGKGKSQTSHFKNRLSFTEPRWQKGDKLIETYVTDDEIPEELRQVNNHRAQSRENYRKQKVKRNITLEEDELVDDGQDELLFAGCTNTVPLEWSPMADYSGKREEFLPEVTGPAHAYANGYEAFRQFWEDDILAHIVKETNRYGNALSRSCRPFAQEWYETNIHEILILFSFWMMLGILRMPTTKSCFTLNPMLQVNIFRHMFSKTRYTTLCRAFSLQYNENNTRTDDSNLTNSLGPILDHLNSRFMESYIPAQSIYIDESLLLSKGSLSFRQHINTKAPRVGVKSFELCESATGYLLKFFIYLGADTVYDPEFPPTLLKSTATVLHLVKPLLDKGHTLYLDNWFNSPLLAKYLKARKTDCVGTIRANCRNIPPIIPQCTLQDGHFVARHSGHVVVMAYQDRNRKVTTISTFHGTEQNCRDPKPNRKKVFKPQAILDYNRGMGGVDRKDQMLEPYLSKRCAKWHLKVFKRLLNCSILNARILLQGTAANNTDHLVFRLELVEQILLHHLQKCPKTKPVGSMLRRIGHDTSAEKHWPQQIEAVLTSGRRCRRRCVWCSRNKTNSRRTTFVCSECEVPLCVQPCFKEYHDHQAKLFPSGQKYTANKIKKSRLNLK